MPGVRFIRPSVHDAVVNFFAERDFTMQEVRTKTLRRWTTIERAERAEAAVHGVPDDAEGSGGEARTSNGDDSGGSGNGRNGQGGGGNNGGGGGAGRGQALSEQRIIAMIAELQQGLRARNGGSSGSGNGGGGGNDYNDSSGDGGNHYSGGGNSFIRRRQQLRRQRWTRLQQQHWQRLRHPGPRDCESLRQDTPRALLCGSP
jgi:hypothetical protein